jgi:hypothetical protein
LIVPHRAGGRTFVTAGAIVAARRTIVAETLCRTLRRDRRRVKRTLTILYGLLGPRRPKPLAILYRPYGSRRNDFHARIWSTRLRLERGDLRAAQRPPAIGTYGGLLAFERYGCWRGRRTRNHRTIHEGSWWATHIHVRTMTQHAFPRGRNRWPGTMRAESTQLSL